MAGGGRTQRSWTINMAIWLTLTAAGFLGVVTWSQMKTGLVHFAGVGMKIANEGEEIRTWASILLSGLNADFLPAPVETQ